MIIVDVPTSPLVPSLFQRVVVKDKQVKSFFLLGDQYDLCVIKSDKARMALR